MKSSIRARLSALILSWILAAGCLWTASRIESDGGNLQVSPVRIATPSGTVTAKLYRPASAGPGSPVPGVVLVHGYQNDKETSSAFALELARRGIAALSVDAFGHGSSEPGMRARGATPYKYPNFERRISGPDRYRVMMNFSTLDFFLPKFSEGLRDTSMGGKAAYEWLASRDFVDPAAMGVTGHSMGTWASWSVAAAFPDHKAVVLQCGEIIPEGFHDPSSVRFNNVLLLQAVWDEFAFFRDYRPTVKGLEATEFRYRVFMGQNGPVDWDRTYGSFADGSARRMELLYTNHRLVTHNGKAIAAAVDWFARSFGMEPALPASDRTYFRKELLAGLAMLSALASLLPLLSLLLRIPFFASAAGPLPSRVLLEGRAWRRQAAGAVLLGAATFPFLTQLGHGLAPLPESVFRMTVGNGFLVWLTFLMAVSLVLLVRWFRTGAGRKAGATLHDLALASADAPDSLPWPRIGKSVLLAFLLAGSLYAQAALYDALFGLELRFIWPFFRVFTPERFGQFWVYLPFYGAFFFVNGGVKLFGQLRLPERSGPAATQAVWWLAACGVMLGSLLVWALIEYVPFFLGIGPGADLLLTPLFGGPFMSILLLTIPQFALMFFLAAAMFRRTGYVYTGSLTVGILAAWMLSGGSAIF